MAHFPGHQSEEQRQAALTGAGLTTEQQEEVKAGVISTTPPVQSAGVIDSTVLQDTQDIQFTTPDTTTTDISGLDTDLPELPPTPAADQVSDFAAQFQELQTSLLGEETFRQEQREELGVSALRTTQEDLVSQIQGFQLQSQALANEFKLASERIQQESIGRGRTVGGVAPLTAAAQRRITLRQADVASQALTASATLNAIQGRLVTAQRLIEEAVQKKFGALKAEKEAIIENVSFLISSGVLNREEKKRAEAVRVRENARLEEVRENEIEQKAIWDLVVRAAPNLADQEGGGLTLDQAMNAGTKEEALSILSAGGAFAVGAPQNTFVQRTDPQGNLIELELDPSGRVVGSRVISGKVQPEGVDVFGISPITGKAFTESQSKAGTFASRMESAEDTLSGGRGRFIPFLPRFARSEDRRNFELSEKNFITALLRRESGAAIAPSEFVDAREIYIPITTDNDVILKRKAEARRIVFQGLVNESVGSFEQLQQSLAQPINVVFSPDELIEIELLSGVDVETSTPSTTFNPASFF